MSAPVLVAPERLDVRGDPGMDELARMACGRYGRPDDCELHLYPLTENWTYRVGGPSDPVVLRIYRPGGRSPAQVMSELAWMGALRADAGSLVPAVVPTAGGSQVLELRREAPLKPCYCVMFSCAPGHEPAEDELAAWFPRLGAITARLHQHARAWVRPPGSAGRAGTCAPRSATGRTGGRGSPACPTPGSAASSSGWPRW